MICKDQIPGRLVATANGNVIETPSRLRQGTAHSRHLFSSSSPLEVKAPCAARPEAMLKKTSWQTWWGCLLCSGALLAVRKSCVLGGVMVFLRFVLFRQKTKRNSFTRPKLRETTILHYPVKKVCVSLEAAVFLEKPPRQTKAKTRSTTTKSKVKFAPQC